MLIDVKTIDDLCSDCPNFQIEQYQSKHYNGDTLVTVDNCFRCKGLDGCLYRKNAEAKKKGVKQ